MLCTVMRGSSLPHPVKSFSLVPTQLIFSLGVLRQVLGGSLPIHKSVLPSLNDTMRATLYLPEQSHDPLLQSCPACGEDGGCLGQVLVHMVVRQEEGCCHLVTATPDICLFTEQGEARHRHQHRLHVYGPEVHEEH